MFSFRNIKANIIPNIDEVEKIITDFTVPICFIAVKKRKREPANPPKLKKSKLGIWNALIANEILNIATNPNDKTPPIRDFICIILIIGISLCKIILLMLLSKAQKIVAPIINTFPIKLLLFWKKSISSNFTLRINNPMKINIIPAYALLPGFSFNIKIASKIEKRNSALINNDAIEALVSFNP